MELFISDLDGTLLNSNKEISVYSKERLNKLIKEGINFTIATARTPATVIDILKDINLKLPVVLMNGVIIYDIKDKKYINIESVERSLAESILNVFKENNKSPLVYGIKNDELFVYYKEFIYEVEKDFYNERCNSPYKTFVQIDEYISETEESEIINFIAYDSFEVIKNIYDKLSKLEGVTVDYYEEIYRKGWYYLEAYSSKASKANGIKFLSRYIQTDKVICFGDNLNDIPMFRVSDESYAVSNAKDELKDIATALIESNNDDAVVKFIEKRVKKRYIVKFRSKLI